MLLAFLAVTAVAVVRLHDLFAVVMLFAIYSLLSAGIFLVLHAPDVAFTEAAVGAGISTVLMLATLTLTDRRERAPSGGRRALVPLAVVTVTGAVLIWGTWDLPSFASPDAPVHQHVGTDYLERTPDEIGIPNVVTAVLASYRGYDTLGEVTVVFTGGVGVLLLLGAGRRAARGDRS